MSNAEAVGVEFLANPGVVSICQSFGMLSTQYHVTGKGLEEAVVGEKATVIVANTNDHETGSALRRIECTLESEITASQVAGVVEALDGNRYMISYEAINKGKHLLHIKVHGIYITGSPFSVMIQTSGNVIEYSLGTVGPLGGPCGITFNTNGNIVITGNNYKTVSEYSLKGVCIRSFAMHGSGKGQLLYPRGLAVTGKGDFVIADSSNHRISIFSQDGTFMKNVGGPKGLQPLCFNQPKDVAWNPQTCQLCIVDSNHRVQVLNSDYTFSATFGKLGKKHGYFNDPYGIACDSAGCIYVADTMNDRIQVFTSGGNFLREIVLGDCVGTHYPVAVAVDSKRLVYVSEYSMHRVTVFTSNGSFVTSFGKSGTSLNDFRYPRGLAVDGSGVVCVCDYDNDRVSIF